MGSGLPSVILLPELPLAEAQEVGFLKAWLGDFIVICHSGIYDCPMVPDEGHCISQRFILHELPVIRAYYLYPTFFSPPFL